MGSIHLLHVDDDPGFADLTAAKLRRLREDLTVTTVDNAADGRDRLADRDVDCVVSGYDMPETDGLEFLSMVRESHPEVPFVMFTGTGSETLAGEAISAGADGYLPKDEYSEQFRLLLQRVERLVSQSRAGTSYREVFDKTDVPLSIRDPETGAFVDANEQYCELIGYDRDEIPSLTSDEIGVGEPPYTTERVHELLRETVEDGARTVEWLNERSDGERIHVESTLQPATIRGKQRVLVSSRDVTEQKRRKAELERKNDLLEKTQRLAQVGGWEYDVGDDTFRWTDEVGRIHGMPPAYDPDLESALEYYHPEDREAVRAAVEGAVEHGESYELDARLLADDEAVRWVRTRGDVREAENGVVLRGTILDVTESKRREQRLRDLQRRTRELIRAESVDEMAHIAVDVAEQSLGLPLSGIYLDDGDGTLRGTAVTEALVEVFGQRPSYDRHDDDAVTQLVWDVFEDGERLVIQDVEDRPEVEAATPARSGIFHPLGEHGVFVTSSAEPAAFDETDEVLAEMLATTLTTALDRMERERRYDAIFNQTFQFTGLMEPDGTLVEANDTALEFVGTDRETVLGDPLWETPWFQHDDDGRHIARESVAQASGGAFFRDEIAVRGADGETVIVDYSVRPVTDENGEVDLLVPEGRDITRLKNREAELERKNEQLEEFASVVSHDLRNPLSVAKGHLELAREGSEDDDLRRVAEAHERMSSLIDDLLTLAKHGESVDAVEAFDLGAAADSAWSSVDTGTATLRTDGDRTVEGDPGRVRQLFENLFRNAVDHGPDDVAVRVGPLEAGDGFYVADDGPGIPADEREAVFEAGHTTYEDGTGFGLRIVEQIAVAHDWSVRVSESADGGARFEVVGLDADREEAPGTGPTP